MTAFSVLSVTSMALNPSATLYKGRPARFRSSFFSRNALSNSAAFMAPPPLTNWTNYRGVCDGRERVARTFAVPRFWPDQLELSGWFVAWLVGAHQTVIRH